MSSVQSIGGGSPVVPKTQTAKAETAAQEATETAAVTKAEAAKGDQQAVRKLAREQAQAKTASQTQKSEPAKPLTPGNVNFTA